MPSTGVCKSCGDMIIWARREDNPERWARPLDALSVQAGIAVINDIAVLTNVYKPHVCRESGQPMPEDPYLEQRTDYARTFAAVDRQMHEIGNEASYAIAARVDCPQCEAQAGELCLHIGALKKGERVEIKWPHWQRYRAAGEQMEREAAEAVPSFDEEYEAWRNSPEGQQYYALQAAGRRMKRGRSPRQAWHAVQGVACPKCGVIRGACDNQANNNREMKWPHPERWLSMERAKEEADG